MSILSPGDLEEAYNTNEVLVNRHTERLIAVAKAQETQTLKDERERGAFLVSMYKESPAYEIVKKFWGDLNAKSIN